MKKNIKKQKGWLLPSVLMIVASVSVITMIHLHSFVQLFQEARQDVYVEQARMLAEGGLTYGIDKVKNGDSSFKQTLSLSAGQIEVQVQQKGSQYFIIAVGRVKNQNRFFQKRLSILTDSNGTVQKWME